MSASAIHWKQPSHPGLLSVEPGTAPFSTRAVSLRLLPQNAVFAKMTAATPAKSRSYTTVQSSRNEDIELNSDLVFCNHSCKPSLVFDMKNMEVRVVGDRPLQEGADLTFFYPSTEWDMDQPFECNCGAGSDCVGTVRGARYLDDKTLGRYWLNSHVKELMAERPGSNGTARTNRTVL